MAVVDVDPVCKLRYIDHFVGRDHEEMREAELVGCIVVHTDRQFHHILDVGVRKGERTRNCLRFGILDYRIEIPLLGRIGQGDFFVHVP